MNPIFNYLSAILLSPDFVFFALMISGFFIFINAGEIVRGVISKWHIFCLIVFAISVFLFCITPNEKQIDSIKNNANNDIYSSQKESMNAIKSLYFDKQEYAYLIEKELT